MILSDFRAVFYFQGITIKNIDGLRLPQSGDIKLECLFFEFAHSDYSEQINARMHEEAEKVMSEGNQ